MPIEHGMPVYKNKPEKRPVVRNTHNYATGNIYESEVTLDMHTGTHIDAPLHAMEGGSTMEIYSLERFVTKAKVLDLTGAKERISAEDLADEDIRKGDFILLKTRNSFHQEFVEDFVYVDKSAAEHLRDIGIAGVGIDSLGIERAQADHGTHKALLGNGIVILEGLRLKEVFKGEYLLCTAPLNIKGVEAAPCRAFLIELEELRFILD